MEGIRPLLVEACFSSLQGGDFAVEIDLKVIRNTLVVKISGELDLLVAEKLRREIDSKIQSQQVKNLVLNLEKVSFIDSSGLGVIIGRYKRMNAENGRMYIVGASPAVEKILIFSGINKLVPLYRSEQDIINI